MVERLAHSLRFSWSESKREREKDEVEQEESHGVDKRHQISVTPKFALSGRVQCGLKMSRLPLSRLSLPLLSLFSFLLTTADAQTCAGYDCLKVTIGDS